MLKFAKAAPYIPDPERSRPLITDQDKERGAHDPPYPVPYHCKPWSDGQRIGWTLFYGFLTPITIVGLGDGRADIENKAELARETNQERVGDHFALGYVGLAVGYTLKTPPGFVSLIIPPTQPPPGLETVPCVIETDWYPRQLFLLFHAPPAGVRVALDHKDELARVVVVPRPEQLTAEPLTAAELEEIAQRRAVYLQEEQTTPTRWQAATGDTFTHLYKEWSKRYRRGEELK
jgi:hypothetical protein